MPHLVRGSLGGQVREPQTGRSWLPSTCASHSRLVIAYSTSPEFVARDAIGANRRGSGRTSRIPAFHHRREARCATIVRRALAAPWVNARSISARLPSVAYHRPTHPGATGSPTGRLGGRRNHPMKRPPTFSTAAQYPPAMNVGRTPARRLARSCPPAGDEEHDLRIAVQCDKLIQIGCAETPENQTGRSQAPHHLRRRRDLPLQDLASRTLRQSRR